MVNRSRNRGKERTGRGILYSSGLIAGEGLVGILLAVLAIIPFRKGTVADFIELKFSLGNAGGIGFFILLLISMMFFVRKDSGEKRKKI